MPGPVAVTPPPWASTIARTIARPMPVPPLAVPKAARSGWLVVRGVMLVA
jgi:hypothetical protein